MHLPQEHNSIYKVSFYISPVYLPFSFAVHPWVIIEKDGNKNRFEIIHFNKQRGEKNYLACNLYGNDMEQGLPFWHNGRYYWKSRCIGSVSGHQDSLAEKMHYFIKNNDYPYLDQYRFYPGPNSNTYIQWILDHFPEANIQLPWNSFGKKYIKQSTNQDN